MDWYGGNTYRHYRNMIFDIFILASAGVLALIAYIFGLTSIAIPANITDSITYAFGYLNTFKGIFPIATLMTCVSLVLYAYVGKYGIKMFFKFVAPYIPFFNRHQIEPFQDTRNTIDLNASHKGRNTLNLRRSKKGRILYTTRDIR